MSITGDFFCPSCCQYHTLAQRGEKRNNQWRCRACVARSRAHRPDVQARKVVRRRALEESDAS